MRSISTITAILILGATAFSIPSVTAQTLLTIGTGSTTGVYYAAGGAICRMMNKERAVHKLRCAVESTSGSVYNVNTLRSGSLDFGIVQSDTQFNAIKGLTHFRSHGANTDLRVVFSIYPEALTVLVRKEIQAGKFTDLKGKRFNLGNPESGTRQTVSLLMEALKMQASDFSQATELMPDEHGIALCSNQIDGFAFVVGNPAANIRDTTTTCGAKLLPVTGPEIDALVKKYPYLSPVTIPGGIYPGNPDPTPSIGVIASLVTSAKVPDEVVYALVSSVFNNLEAFKKTHPALADLDSEAMIRSSVFAPLHPGALRYYREKGWLPEEKPEPPKKAKTKKNKG